MKNIKADQRQPSYLDLIAREPYVKDILEGVLGTTPIYRLQQIKETDRYMAFWFIASTSLQINFANMDAVSKLVKHAVTIQIPGNQEYSFSITIDK